jgi:hypothetical protein
VKQKKVLYITAAVIALMVLFPPCKYKFPYGIKTSGYHFLLNMPGYAVMDIQTLAVQVIAALIVGGLVYVAVGKGSKI